MSDRIDIHGPIFEICERLGLEPRDVSEIIFNPSEVIVTVFRTNEHGSPYLENGEFATQTKFFKVAT